MTVIFNWIFFYRRYKHYVTDQLVGFVFLRNFRFYICKKKTRYIDPQMDIIGDFFTGFITIEIGPIGNKKKPLTFHLGALQGKWRYV